MERFPSPIADYYVALEEPTLKVLDVFPGQLPEDYLHIVVKQLLGKCE